MLDQLKKESLKLNHFSAFFTRDKSTISFLNYYFLNKKTKRLYFLQTTFSAIYFLHFFD